VNFISDPKNPQNSPPEEKYSQYLLSSIHQQEAKLRGAPISTLTSQLQTSKYSEHYTLLNNAVNEIMGDEQIDTFLPEPGERAKETVRYVKEKAGLNRREEEKESRNLQVPNRKSPMRSSKDSLNDRTTINRDLDMVSNGHSDLNERDIDLEEQYEEMIQGKGFDEIDEDDSDGSINDVDRDLTDLYTGV
jgi:hypothetical protein